MISRLPKLLKEMLLHRCAKKELCLRSIKIMEKKYLLLGHWGEGQEAQEVGQKTKQMNKKNTIRIKMYY